MAKINGEEYVSICPDLETETETQTAGERMIEILTAGRQRSREENTKMQTGVLLPRPDRTDDDGTAGEFGCGRGDEC
jgi:hypothetical protein